MVLTKVSASLTSMMSEMGDTSNLAANLCNQNMFNRPFFNTKYLSHLGRRPLEKAEAPAKMWLNLNWS